MSYSHDFWDLSHSQHSYQSIHIFYESQQSIQRPPDSYQQFLRNPQIEPVEIPPQASNEESVQSLSKQEQIFPRMTKQEGNQFAGNIIGNRRKKIKPSPYHNYQKHLNTTLRQLLVFPNIQSNSHISVYVASRLWGIFIQSRCQTKKILHFIFNEFNQYRIKNHQIHELGFAQTYSQCSKQILGEAKTYLTNLAIEQLNDENVDRYLEHRRIKNPQKFKRYLMVFKKELQDGFLKKRFTNRNRKQKIRKEHLLKQ